MHSNRGTHCNSSEARRDHYNRVGLEQPQHGCIGWAQAFFCLLFFGIAVEPAVHGHRKVSASRRHEAKSTIEQVILEYTISINLRINKKMALISPDSYRERELGIEKICVRPAAGEYSTST